MDTQEQSSAVPVDEWQDQPTAVIELEGQHKPTRVSLETLVKIMTGRRHGKV
jgi:hypothetical protein